MRLLPSHCDACGRSALVAERAALEGSAVCRECGTPARTLPGETYLPKDAPLFDQLEASLREARITALEAAHLLAQLDARDRAAPGHGLAMLISALPSLAHLNELVPREPGAIRKAEGMLGALLTAHSARRSPSGFVSTESAARRSTKG